MFGVIILAFLLSATTVPVNGDEIDDAVNLIYQSVIDARYDTAVEASLAMADSPNADEILSKTVKKLLDSRSIANANTMSYAYKLRKANKELVTKYFPLPITNILNQDTVNIVNKKYQQALKLEIEAGQTGDRQAFGARMAKTGPRVTWNFIPIWENNGVIFKIKYLQRSAFLKVSNSADSNGIRIVYGSTESDTDRHKFYLEPQNDGSQLVFFIVNFMFCQGLELSAELFQGDRELRTHENDICPAMDEFKWIITKL